MQSRRPMPLDETGAKMSNGITGRQRLPDTRTDFHAGRGLSQIPGAEQVCHTIWTIFETGLTMVGSGAWRPSDIGRGGLPAQPSSFAESFVASAAPRIALHVEPPCRHLQDRAMLDRNTRDRATVRGRLPTWSNSSCWQVLFTTISRNNLKCPMDFSRRTSGVLAGRHGLPLPAVAAWAQSRRRRSRTTQGDRTQTRRAPDRGRHPVRRFSLFDLDHSDLKSPRAETPGRRPMTVMMTKVRRRDRI